jgi:two-component system, NarL family, sensor histidine kinase BarA
MGKTQMELYNLPVIDWDQAIKLAGNKRELAEELLGMLVNNITHDVTMIQKLYNAQIFPDLLRQVHKLHGALSYCGVPRLKTLLATLENDLRNNISDHLPTLLGQLDTEVKLLLECYPHHVNMLLNKQTASN